MTQPLLEIRSLTMVFGGVKALTEVDLSVKEASVHGLIGPNGAGKSTLLNCISRLIAPTSGSMRYGDVNLLAAAPHQIASLGIARSFQNLGLIGELSVIDNVMAGMHSRHPGRLVDELLLIPRRNRFERDMRAKAVEALAMAGLSDVAQRRVGELSYGTCKAVELARAAALDPRLLLLDEPTAGLNTLEMDNLRSALIDLRQRTSVTILVISHHIDFLLGIVDELTVLDLGRRIASGEPQAVKNDPKVIAAYLGTEE